MQNTIRGFLMGCGRSKGSSSPSSVASNIKKSAQGAEDFGVDMNKSFKVGYKSVRQATKKLMEIIKQERKYRSADMRMDLYTNWNTPIEEMLRNDLLKHYPKHKFITEDNKNFKTARELTKEPTWIIDPIDGTTNFIHGFRYAAVSLALWINKQPQFGIVWNPFLDQCYIARRGFGSYMNVQPLNVSDCHDLSEALIMYELGVDPKIRHENLINNVNKLMDYAHGQRTLGSTALNMCMVAQGYADAYYDFGCHAWNMAAATMVVQEAGGVVLDPSLQPFDLMSRRVLCASTPQLAEELSSKLSLLQPTPRDDNKLLKPAERVESNTVISQILPCPKPKRTKKKRNNNKLNPKRSRTNYKMSSKQKSYSGEHKNCTRKTSDFGDPILPGQLELNK